MKIQVQKIYSDRENNVCYFSKDIYDALKIDTRDKYIIHLGQFSNSCSIKSTDDSNSCIYFSKFLYDYFFLHKNLSLNMWKKDNHLYLGPVVAIYMSKSSFKLIKNNKISVSIVDYIKNASPYVNCLSYCFSNDNIDWENKKIKGYTFVKRLNYWQELWLPMPDVIYDRDPFDNPNDTNESNKVRRQFKNFFSTEFINSNETLNKYLLYKSLLKYSENNFYLPETIYYKSFDDVSYMLEKFNYVFFKPSKESREDEVLSIEKEGEKYKLQFNTCKYKITLIDRMDKIKDTIEKYVTQKEGKFGFMVQQGIKCTDEKGNLKILIIKNQEGKWESFSESEFSEIVCRIGEFIEWEFGHFGEMEINIAIDEDDKIWFLGANTKPEKYRNISTKNQYKILPQALSIFKYAIYLATNKINKYKE
ncbi:MAG: hypothetical protein VB130_14485 [Clostridium sp.]|nr:hypothetical protein [Clostridium sp.]